jgi:hypothetical protein
MMTELLCLQNLYNSTQEIGQNTLWLNSDRILKRILKNQAKENINLGKPLNNGMILYYNIQNRPQYWKGQ